MSGVPFLVVFLIQTTSGIIIDILATKTRLSRTLVKKVSVVSGMPALHTFLITADIILCVRWFMLAYMLAITVSSLGRHSLRFHCPSSANHDLALQDHSIVYLQLSLVLILPTLEGWPGWVNPGGWLNTKMGQMIQTKVLPLLQTATILTPMYSVSQNRPWLVYHYYSVLSFMTPKLSASWRCIYRSRVRTVLHAFPMTHVQDSSH